MGTLKFTLCLALIIGICSCNTKKQSNDVRDKQPVSLKVRMTDSHSPYSAVFIDLQGVEISSKGVTVPLNVHSGIYNLLNFANGIDTIIAFGMIAAEEIESINLVLGPNNAVVSNGSIYGLITSGAEFTGLKILINKVLDPEEANGILLDFNTNQSIIRTANDVFRLKSNMKSVKS
jgi:hypothetical protein